jgi:transcriptional regulator NrdR family protein
MCPKCSSADLDVEDEDESDGSGIYYRLTCKKCGFRWKEDGPDY